MNTGRHYYEQLPASVQQKFLMNVDRSGIYTIDEVMQNEYMSHKLFILCPFTQHDSPEGKEYWNHIAEGRYYVEPEGKLIIWFNRNTKLIAITMTAMSAVMLLILMLLINKHNEELKKWRASDAAKDSINTINAVNNERNKKAINNQTYLPPGYDALLTKEEQYERMMDNTDTIPKY